MYVRMYIYIRALGSAISRAALPTRSLEGLAVSLGWGESNDGDQKANAKVRPNGMEI